MRIARAETTPWTEIRAVRGGNIEFKTLLEGVEGSKTNYHLLLANTDRKFNSPRHRHNFDQIRYGLVGSTNFSPKKNLEPGDLAYFPEGTYYGPQRQEEVGESSLSMVIQFGGPSGSGYMSQRQLFENFDKLASEGTFEGGVYRSNSPSREGRLVQDAYEAVWEKNSLRSVKYSEPRYMEAVQMREKNFCWRRSDQSGIETKDLGTFTETCIGVSFLRLESGASFKTKIEPSMQLFFVKEGEGASADGDIWSAHSAFEVEAGESVELRAAAQSVVLIARLPSFAGVDQ